MATPSNNNCTVSKFLKYYFYFAQTCNGNAATDIISLTKVSHRHIKLPQMKHWPQNEATVKASYQILLWLTPSHLLKLRCNGFRLRRQKQLQYVKNVKKRRATLATFTHPVNLCMRHHQSHSAHSNTFLSLLPDLFACLPLLLVFIFCLYKLYLTVSAHDDTIWWKHLVWHLLGSFMHLMHTFQLWRV